VGNLLLQADELALGDGNDVVRSFVDDLLGRMGLASPPQPEARKKPQAATRLTDREQAIIAFIATGNSNKEIARELGVAPETIKTHVKRIFHKLSAETRAQAVVRAQSLGMLGSSARPLDAHQGSAS
jgi:LuxR family maltose regulon positive regulatory protein